MIAGISGMDTSFNIYLHPGYSRTGAAYGRVQRTGNVQAASTQQTGRIQGMDNVQKTTGILVPSGGRTSNLGTPVEPVSPVSAVDVNGTNGISNAIPFLRKGMDPAEMAVRMRIQYADSAQGRQTEDPSGVESAQKVAEEGKCETCENRKYQDGSDDAGVSYKTPSHISPDQAAAKVRGHEMEHVVRERAKAEREERQVVSQSVTMHTGICPECGRVYVSGGTTRTTTASDSKPNQEELSQEAEGQRTPFSAVA